MSVYDDAKQIDFRQIAVTYGLITNERQRTCLCPFHGDKHPSMQIYADHAYCFACGTWTDGIKLVNHMLNKDAHDRAGAEHICATFGLTNRHVSDEIIRQNKKKREEAENRKKYVDKCYDLMIEYMRLLQRWAKQYSPKCPEELDEADWRWCTAMHGLPEVEYFLDLYFELSEEEYYNFLQQLRAEGYLGCIYATVDIDKILHGDKTKEVTL